MKHVLEGIKFANFSQNFWKEFGKQYSKMFKTLCLQKFNTFESIKKKMGAGSKVTYVSFSPTNISSFMGFETLQIHCYYRISQEQSISTGTFQTMI